MNKPEERLQCNADGCDVWFIKKTHNQKFHDDECCRVQTNKRIMEKYYAKRDQRLGKTRYCTECGKTKLSRYNDSTICSSCDMSQVIKTNNSVLNMLSNISWQS